MAGLYWLIFLITAIAIGIYVNYWYHRPSGIPETLIASFSYQTLKYIESYAGRHEKDPERDPVSKAQLIVPYLKDRGLIWRHWRQRNDIIRYMKRMNWIYKHDPQSEDMFVLSEDGKRELEISTDQEKAQAALTIAAALRMRAVPPESRQRAGEAAKEIEEGVRAHDPDKIDHGITRVRDVLQILTLALPLLRDIGRILGLLALARLDKVHGTCQP